MNNSQEKEDKREKRKKTKTKVPSGGGQRKTSIKILGFSLFSLFENKSKLFFLLSISRENNSFWVELKL